MSRWKFSGNLVIIAFVYVIFTDVARTAWAQSDGTTSKESIMEPAEKISTTKLTDGLNNFGYKLSLQLLKESNNTNIVLSPTGINGLLAMALLGSVGKSYDELSEQLGFSQDVLANRKHHEQFGQLLQELNSNDTYSKTLYADAAFVDSNYKLREGYKTYLSEVYHGALLTVDFKDSETVKNVINDWVNDKTNGKLTTFLKDALPTDTKVALLSALYFSGQWEVPFITEHTLKLPFETALGQEEEVDQMLNIGHFKYALALDEGFEILALPYNDSVTTLYALKPQFPKKKSLLEVLDSLDYEKINNVIGKMESTECVIRFPKLNLTSDLKLEKTLKQLGINKIFSPEEANFALMVDQNVSPNTTEEEIIQRINSADADSMLRSVLSSLQNPRLYVDTVLHSVKITIDEYGTEATAASGAFLARTATLFYLNSPFYIFIRNEKTQLVTFSAVINDPVI